MSTSIAYFTGPFAPMCDAFVTQMRSLGRAYKQQAMLLRMFDNFSKGYSIQGFTITEELASAWSKKRPNEAESTRHSRVGEMHRFARFLEGQGHSTFLVPGKIPRKSLHHPYIFSSGEISRIFDYTSALKRTETYGTKRSGSAQRTV